MHGDGFQNLKYVNIFIEFFNIKIILRKYWYISGFLNKQIITHTHTHTHTHGYSQIINDK